MNSKGIMRTSILCVYAITLLAVLFPASAELPQHVHLQNFAPLDEESFREGDAWPLQVYFGAKVAVRDGLHRHAGGSDHRTCRGLHADHERLDANGYDHGL
jgi:hypothetical protein